VNLDEPFAIAANPCSRSVVVAGEVALPANGFAQAAIRNDSDLRREHPKLMVANLEADQRAGVKAFHDLLARLDGLFDVEKVREQQGVEGSKIVVLQRLPPMDLLDEDEVRLGVDVFGSRDLLGGHRGDARGEQHEDKDWLHGCEFNPNGPDCILHSWR
jgi:hypothetical protein